MKFSEPLVQGRLIRRYKRFLADVELPTGGYMVVAHCANPGSMAGLAEPGAEVWLSPSSNPKRKLKWTWELVRDAGTGGLVGIHTGRANAIVEDALTAGLVDPSLRFDRFRREVKYGTGSRVDFMLESDAGPPCYLEVKSVTLRRSLQRPHHAEFPDAVTARGARHLQELANVKKAGARAVLVYLVQRDDCDTVGLAADIDPAYAAAAQDAVSHGVEMFALRCRLSPEEIIATGPLPMAPLPPAR